MRTSGCLGPWGCGTGCGLGQCSSRCPSGDPPELPFSIPLPHPPPTPSHPCPCTPSPWPAPRRCFHTLGQAGSWGSGPMVWHLALVLVLPLGHGTSASRAPGSPCAMGPGECWGGKGLSWGLVGKEHVASARDYVTITEGPSVGGGRAAPWGREARQSWTEDPSGPRMAWSHRPVRPGTVMS